MEIFIVTAMNASDLTENIRVFGLEVLIPVVKEIVVKQLAEPNLTLASAALCIWCGGAYAFT
jgi:hypothetical protein